MKKKSKIPVPSTREPTEEEIRDYAYHLYQQSGCVPGRDVDNWLEAKACLEANIPRQHAHARLHRRRHPEACETVTVIALEAQPGPGDDAFAAEADDELIIEALLGITAPPK